MTAGFQFRPPSGEAMIRAVYGDIKERDLAKGMLSIDPGWEAENLVTLRDVCSTELNVRLHRLVVPSFEHCLVEAIARAPDYKIRMLGGFCARRKMNNPSKRPSLHSWGAAFDANWDMNGFGHDGQRDLPDAVIDAFEAEGWEWGGSWRVPDYMHFQFATDF